MRLVVHDYSGHPGQVHLSRELARRGHHVEHQFCASYTTGRGATQRREGDPETFTVRAIELPRPFSRYSPAMRLWQELQYSRIAARAVLATRPDLAVLSNVPLISLFLLTLWLRIRRVPYVFWQQDIYSDAIGVVARQRLGWLGGPIGWLASHAERSVARGAAAITPISQTFVEQLNAWGIPASKVQVIRNWAAIDEIPIRPRDNAWAKAHGLVGSPVVMYAGTLGLKHNPAILATLARSAPTGCRVVVVSEGLGREWLESNAAGEPALLLLDYQPYEQLPDMLASADVLVVVLERDASRYSVPSKVLNYLCAGRPVLGLLPANNAVAQMIETAQAGVVVDPGNAAEASPALNRLLADSNTREKMGTAARRYAEQAFDVYAVGDLFDSVFRAVYDRRLVLISKRSFRMPRCCDAYARERRTTA